MDYRKFYEQETGFEMPDDFDVHHIDGNRENNDIRNLVALPKELHTKYHATAAALLKIEEADFVVKSVIDQGCHNVNHKIELLEYCLIAYQDCCDLVDYRDFLLGILPDIHGIEK